jgi:glycosyltransferase involved in cell wall biosynthesis
MTATPEKRIGFYTDGPAFDGGSLAAQALGGSETALIQMARALAGRGHRVMVFNNVAAPGVWDGVRYQPARSFPLFAVQPGFDVFIVSRYYGFFSLPFTARLKVLWNHDILDRPRSLKALADGIDLFLVLSRFHRDHYATRLPDIESRLVVTRNGLDLDLAARASAGAVRDPARMMYASRPERGLGLLLETIWPRLKRVRPDLKLWISGYHVPRDRLAPGLAEQYDRIDALVQRSPGVEPLGALPKAEYYGRLAGSALMLYPCVFPEISCLAALETQALGTPMVTTDGFALSETVMEPSFKVGGRPGSDEYVRAFVDRTITFLNNPDQALNAAGRARTDVFGRHGWDRIAAEWDRLFDLTIQAKEKSLKTAGRIHAG